jgi:DNA-binding response OmpR family regulator
VNTVLLIDDEPQMVSLVAMCLEEFGARVVRAENLAGALTSARAEPPRAVLLDLALGREEEDGLMLLPKLWSEPALSGVPVVVFSVHESRRREALDAGANGFVPKPFRPEQLRAAVRPYLGGP